MCYVHPQEDAVQNLFVRLSDVDRSAELERRRSSSEAHAVLRDLLVRGDIVRSWSGRCSWRPVLWAFGAQDSTE
jgi:hypothetical protein